MLRKDRNLVEDMFHNGDIKVLCSTSTLAWGVNLPAYAVIIKGTKVYDSSAGAYKDIGVFDVQ
jgi:replicative superfamily II helicase